MTYSILPPSNDDKEDSFTSLGLGGMTMASNQNTYSGTMANVTIGAIGGGGYNYSPSSVVTIGGNGGSGVYTMGASNWNSAQPSLKVTGDADFEGDVKIRGKSIVALLQKIEDRLAILQPDPKRLAKYEALQEAYEHYKVLEALCVEDNVDPTKK